MDDGIENYAKNIQRKYIGFEPMLFISVIALLIIYYYVFSSLGNNEDGQASSLKVFFETGLWLVFIVLLLLNGITYIFGIDIIKSFKRLIGDEEDVNEEINPEEKKKIKLALREQVFHLPEQKYSYKDATAACNAQDARLANFDEVVNAYTNGGDWCSYGWSDNQMALYPTQKEKWEQLQKMTGHEKDCGRPGVNGGYIKNINTKYGANCFGNKPNITPDDADRMRNKAKFKKNSKERNFDKRVDFWRNNKAAIEVAPFNHDNWSML